MLLLRMKKLGEKKSERENNGDEAAAPARLSLTNAGPWPIPSQAVAH
jgi:hypothetical protein